MIMTFKVVVFRILPIVLYATTRIVAYPGSDLDETTRKTGEKLNEYSKQFEDYKYEVTEDGTGWNNETVLYGNNETVLYGYNETVLYG